MLVNILFDIFSNSDSISEIKLKCDLSLGFEIIQKPLSRGLAQQLLILLSSKIGHVYSYSHSKTNQKDALINKFIKNIIEIQKITPLFKNLKYDDVKNEINIFYNWHCLMSDGNYNYHNVEEDTEKLVEILEHL